MLQDRPVLPYYFYMCDMIRIGALAHEVGRHRSSSTTHGYLPDCDPRIVCDVPTSASVVHQVRSTIARRGSRTGQELPTGIETTARRRSAPLPVLRSDLPLPEAASVVGEQVAKGAHRALFSPSM